MKRRMFTSKAKKAPGNRDRTIAKKQQQPISIRLTIPCDRSERKKFTSPFWNSLGANIGNGRSSYHFDISSLSREIKMKVSLARRTKQEWRCKSRRVRTHHTTSRVAVRRLGRIIQRIFLPNQEAALVEPFGNGLVRVGSQGLFSPFL